MLLVNVSLNAPTTTVQPLSIYLEPSYSPTEHWSIRNVYNINELVLLAVVIFGAEPHIERLDRVKSGYRNARTNKLEATAIDGEQSI